MSKAIAAVGFDYEGIDKDIKGKLTYLAGQIRKSTKSHIENVLELGKLIEQAHEALAGGGRDGEFGPWVEAECGFTKKTAYNYLHAFQRFNKCESLSHFSAEAVYALAGPDVPDKAVSEAVKLADKGVRVNAGKAREILDKFREVHKANPRKKPAPAAAESPAKLDVSPIEETASPPAPTGPCVRTGGEHCWGPDEDKPGYLCCLECGEPGELIAVDPEPDVPASKLFAKIDEHLGKIVRLLDDVNKVAPNEALRKAIMESLGVANEDIRRWKKGAKK